MGKTSFIIGLGTGLAAASDIIREAKTSKTVYVEKPTYTTDTSRYVQGGSYTRGSYTGGRTYTNQPTLITRLEAFERALNPLGYFYNQDESDFKSGEHSRYYFYGRKNSDFIQVRIKTWSYGRAEFRIQVRNSYGDWVKLSEASGHVDRNSITVNSGNSLPWAYRYLDPECNRIFKAIDHAW